jgi:hypothetical protein
MKAHIEDLYLSLNLETTRVEHVMKVLQCNAGWEEELRVDPTRAAGRELDFLKWKPYDTLGGIAQSLLFAIASGKELIAATASQYPKVLEREDVQNSLKFFELGCVITGLGNSVAERLGENPRKAFIECADEYLAKEGQCDFLAFFKEADFVIPKGCENFHTSPCDDEQTFLETVYLALCRRHNYDAYRAEFEGRELSDNSSEDRGLVACIRQLGELEQKELGEWLQNYRRNNYLHDGFEERYPYLFQRLEVKGGVDGS